MTKMTKKQITKTVLEAVATEFNSVILDEESGIQTGKDVAKDDLQADVIEVAGIIEATDLPNLSEKTLEVLSVLGVELPEATETEQVVEEIVEEVAEEVVEQTAEEETEELAGSEEKKISNKFLVYQEWIKSGKTKNFDQLHEFVEQKVKLSTIKNWVTSWKKGKYLPAGASN